MTGAGWFKSGFIAHYLGRTSDHFYNRATGGLQVSGATGSFSWTDANTKVQIMTPACAGLCFLAPPPSRPVGQSQIIPQRY